MAEVRSRAWRAALAGMSRDSAWLTSLAPSPERSTAGHPSVNNWEETEGAGDPDLLVALEAHHGGGATKLLGEGALLASLEGGGPWVD